MRPGGVCTEASSRRADYKFHPRGTGDGRCFLIQGVRIQRRIAVSKAAVGRTPGTRWFGEALKDTKCILIS